MTAQVIPFSNAGLPGIRSDNRCRPNPRPMEVEPLYEHQRAAYSALGWPEYLSDWERAFLSTMTAERRPSVRQRDVLRTICVKVGRSRFRGDRP